MTRRGPDRGPEPLLPIEPLTEDQVEALEDRLVATLAGQDLGAGREPPRIPDAPEEAGDDAEIAEPSEPKHSDRRRGLVLALAATGLAAAAATLLAVYPPRPIDAPDLGGRGRGLASQRIATGAAPAAAQLGDVDLALGTETTLVAVGDDPSGWLVLLETGSTRFVVPPREERPPFIVQAGSVRIEVLGTVFTVARGAHGVTVTVERGEVRVSGPAGAQVLGAGDVYGATATTPSPPTVTKVPELGADEGDTTDGDARRPSRPSAKDRYEAASRLEATAPRRALRLYRQVAQEGGPWAPNALYAAGRLASETDRPAVARALLEGYVARYPDGPNVPDARVLLRALPDPAAR